MNDPDRGTLLPIVFPLMVAHYMIFDEEKGKGQLPSLTDLLIDEEDPSSFDVDYALHMDYELVNNDKKPV